MIPDLRFYDFEFNLLQIVHDFTSALWSVKYNDIGTFEAHFPLTSNVINAIFDKPYVVAVQGDRQAIITSRQVDKEFVLFGRTVNWLLSKRVTPSFTKTGTVSDMCANFVSDAFLGVDNIVVNSNENFAESFEFLKESYTLTSDVVRECLALDGGGHNMVFDVRNKQWVFNVLSGKNLSRIVSEDNRNAYDLSYTTDLLEYANKGYYQKQIEGEAIKNEWTILDNDASKTGIYAFYSVLSGQTDEDAKSDLNNKLIKTQSSFMMRDLKYGKDYNLGDVVTVEFVIGSYKKREKKKISGIDIVYENNITSEKPIFEEVL